MNIINGLYMPQKGNIYYKGKKINKLKPHKRAKLGMARTFQKVEVFGGMTVLDNIRLGRHIHSKSGIVSGSIYMGIVDRYIWVKLRGKRLNTGPLSKEE